MCFFSSLFVKSRVQMNSRKACRSRFLSPTVMFHEIIRALLGSSGARELKCEHCCAPRPCTSYHFLRSFARTNRRLCIQTRRRSRWICDRSRRGASVRLCKDLAEMSVGVARALVSFVHASGANVAGCEVVTAKLSSAHARVTRRDERFGLATKAQCCGPNLRSCAGVLRVNAVQTQP